MKQQDILRVTAARSQILICVYIMISSILSPFQSKESMNF